MRVLVEVTLNFLDDGIGCYPCLFLVVATKYESFCQAPPGRPLTMRLYRSTSTQWKLHCGRVDCGRTTYVTTQNKMLSVISGSLRSLLRLSVYDRLQR